MSKTLFFLFCVSLLFASLRDKIIYGSEYYDLKIRSLQNENIELKKEVDRLQKEIKKLEHILKVHQKALLFLVNKESNRLKVYKTIRPTILCADKSCKKVVANLSDDYYLKGIKEGDVVRVKYYLYDNRFWHFVKRNRWIKLKDLKESNISISKECNSVKECKALSKEN